VTEWPFRVNVCTAGSSSQSENPISAQKKSGAERRSATKNGAFP
jgi:hypothetical protein